MIAFDISKRLTIDLGEEPMILLGTRAILRERTRQLFIADLHLGKADIMRRGGIALPTGGTQDDLARLSSLIQSENPVSLIILGDLLHGPVHDSKWLTMWNQWRRMHKSLDIAVVTGNHDRALNAVELSVRLLPTVTIDGPFVLSHHPLNYPGKHLLCGHVHPIAAVPGLRQRWPVFITNAARTVLPAFSQFTAGQTLAIDAQTSMFACVNDMIVPMNRKRQQTNDELAKYFTDDDSIDSPTEFD